VALLTSRRAVLDRAARRLPEKETLDEAELRTLVEPDIRLAAQRTDEARPLRQGTAGSDVCLVVRGGENARTAYDRGGFRK
jgi:hypothetical protein